MEGFTPGPWRVQFNGTTASIYSDSKNGTYPAVALLQRVQRPCTAANAYLIASAPSMFEYIKKRADGGDVEALELVELVSAAAK